MSATLFERLGGHAAIDAFAKDLLPRLQSDAALGRFWEHRGDDGIAREKQLLIDYLTSVTGGPVYYTGRDMKLTHVGMGISESDWGAFLGHAVAAMTALGVGEAEQGDVAAFVSTIKDDIVEC